MLNSAIRWQDLCLLCNYVKFYVILFDEVYDYVLLNKSFYICTVELNSMAEIWI